LWGRAGKLNKTKKQKEYPMRKLILAGAAILSLSAAIPAYAQDNAAGAGAAVGATSGATLGFIFGGPVGAIIGGFSGAVIGGTVSEAAVTYAGNNPVEEVYLDTDLDVGVKVSGDVKLYPIEGEDDLSYFYANGRVWIVSTSSGEIVASPGFVVSEKAVAYVKANPTESITIEGTVEPGFTVDADVDLIDVPDARGYAYFYVDDRPALVDVGSRTVVWIG
jgi:hypothetical protein